MQCVFLSFLSDLQCISFSVTAQWRFAGLWSFLFFSLFMELLQVFGFAVFGCFFGVPHLPVFTPVDSWRTFVKLSRENCYNNPTMAASHQLVISLLMTTSCVRCVRLIDFFDSSARQWLWPTFLPIAAERRHMNFETIAMRGIFLPARAASIYSYPSVNRGPCFVHGRSQYHCHFFWPFSATQLDKLLTLFLYIVTMSLPFHPWQASSLIDCGPSEISCCCELLMLGAWFGIAIYPTVASEYCSQSVSCVKCDNAYNAPCHVNHVLKSVAADGPTGLHCQTLQTQFWVESMVTKWPR